MYVFKGMNFKMAVMSQRRPVPPQCEKQFKKWAVDKIIYKTNSV